MAVVVAGIEGKAAAAAAAADAVAVRTEKQYEVRAVGDTAGHLWSSVTRTQSPAAPSRAPA